MRAHQHALKESLKTHWLHKEFTLLHAAGNQRLTLLQLLLPLQQRRSQCLLLLEPVVACDTSHSSPQACAGQLERLYDCAAQQGGSEVGQQYNEMAVQHSGTKFWKLVQQLGQYV